MPESSDVPIPPAPAFADLLNHLFATHLGPRGRPHSLREVSEGTGGKLSIAYLSLLRRGGNVGFPSADKVMALATFFGVDIGYFLGSAVSREATDAVDPDLIRALANPQVRDIALRASAMTETERQFIVHLLEQTHHMFSRHDEHGTPPAPGGDDRPEEAAR
jgi:transcriptional regulator with XRE-family HTH domain